MCDGFGPIRSLKGENLTVFLRNCGRSVRVSQMQELYRIDKQNRKYYNSRIKREEERKRNEKVIAEKDQALAELTREIAELKAKLAAK